MPPRRAPARRSPCPAASRRRPSPPSGSPGLALVAALAIAGPGIRIVLGILEVVLGGCVLLAVGVSLGDPVAAVAPAVTDATGVSGAGPTAELVAAATATAWPAAAIAGGVLLVLAGIAVLVTGTRWPASSRRYRGARLADADADAGEGAAQGVRERAASDRAIDDWDELSRGDDPTDDLDRRHRPDGAATDDTAADGRRRRDRRPRRRRCCRPGAPVARRPDGRREPDRTQPLDWPPKPRNEGAS